MEEQKYILSNINTFELKDIFDCGQAACGYDYECRTSHCSGKTTG